MKNFIYKNRYGDNILFREISANKFEVDFLGLYYRYGYGDSEDITIDLRFIDPSGGPFLTLGTNLKDLNTDYLDNLIITKIYSIKDTTKFILEVTNK